MKAVTKFFLILITIFIGGCGSQFKFSDKYIDHFPQKSENKILYYEKSMRVPSEFKQYGAWKKEAYKYEGAVKKLVDSLVVSAKDIVKYGDSCTIILPFRYNKNIDVGKPIIAECRNSPVVIPSFDEVKQFFSLELLDFTFYILKAEQGIFLDKMYLFENELMPSAWSNGYSKGLALSIKEGLAVFWIDIW